MGLPEERGLKNLTKRKGFTFLIKGRLEERKGIYFPRGLKVWWDWPLGT